MKILKLDPATIRRMGEHADLPGPFLADPDSGQIEIEDEVYDELERQAAEAGMTPAEMVRRLVW